MDPYFKERCIKLRGEGRTITEIARITGRNKSSIYPYIHAIPLSAERQAQIRRNSGEWIRQFPIARKGKSTRLFKKFDAWTPRSILLVAHLMFDGELSHGKCVYNNRSEVLIERVQDLMRDIYEYEPRKYLVRSTGVQRIGFYNVELGHYLAKKSQRLLREISNLPKDAQREFLRAFFDDEGCMDFRPTRNHRKIRGYQKDLTILRLVKVILQEFGIQARVEAPNEVVITGKENLRRFQDEINFSPGVRINGNRSNSIWKEHLEKRDLLQRAIDSYRT